MKTKIVKINLQGQKEENLREAANIIKNGGLVIIPTETVYGIAANMLNKNTLEKLYEIKKRPKNKPFSLHIDKKEKIEEFAGAIPISAYKLIDEFWPGPLTIVLKAKEEGGGAIGLRLPSDEIAQEVISLAEVPVVCPSANLSGEKAPINFDEAIKDLDGLVDFAIDAGHTKLGIESSVVDLTVQPPQILRIGAVKKEDIERVIKRKTVLFVCTGNSCRSVMAKALLEKKLKEKNRQDVEVLSAGIMMSAGLGATEATREVLKKEGIDVSAHRSQRITPLLINKADFILVMERLHEERILAVAPQAKNRLFLLKEFAKSDTNAYFDIAKISGGVKIGGNSLDIADPIGSSSEFYEKTFKVIKEAVERVSNII